MASHLWYSHLALWALVWLFVMRHVAGSRRRTRRPPTATPIKPNSKRSNEPKPFDGLTKKPHGALCERATPHPKPPSPVPPEPMPSTHRRRREMDTSQHFCPHSGCDDGGGLGLGHLRANGHPNGAPWRQFYCTSCKGYFPAMVTHVGYWVQPPRRQGKGPRPKPRWVSRPELLYAQVIKTVRRLGKVSHRVVVGTQAAGEQVLAAHGWQGNTVFSERVTRSIRQHVAAVGRRVATRCKGKEGLRQQLALYHVYDNFVLPHASLRQALAEPIPPNGRGSAKQWRPCTPAMAVGLTDPVWSLKEVRRSRVPPWPQPQVR